MQDGRQRGAHSRCVHTAGRRRLHTGGRPDPPPWPGRRSRWPRTRPRVAWWLSTRSASGTTRRATQQASTRRAWRATQLGVAMFSERSWRARSTISSRTAARACETDAISIAEAPFATDHKALGVRMHMDGVEGWNSVERAGRRRPARSMKGWQPLDLQNVRQHVNACMPVLSSSVTRITDVLVLCRSLRSCSAPPQSRIQRDGDAFADRVEGVHHSCGTGQRPARAPGGSSGHPKRIGALPIVAHPRPLVAWGVGQTVIGSQYVLSRGSSCGWRAYRLLRRNRPTSCC